MIVPLELLSCLGIRREILYLLIKRSKSLGHEGWWQAFCSAKSCTTCNHSCGPVKRTRLAPGPHTVPSSVLLVDCVQMQLLCPRWKTSLPISSKLARLQVQPSACYQDVMSTLLLSTSGNMTVYKEKARKIAHKNEVLPMVCSGFVGERGRSGFYLLSLHCDWLCPNLLQWLHDGVIYMQYLFI